MNTLGAMAAMDAMREAVRPLGTTELCRTVDQALYDMSDQSTSRIVSGWARRKRRQFRRQVQATTGPVRWDG